MASMQELLEVPFEDRPAYQTFWLETRYKPSQYNCKVDIAQLAGDIMHNCTCLDRLGYDVVSILDVTQGHFDPFESLGFSSTQGAVITCRKRQQV